MAGDPMGAYEVDHDVTRWETVSLPHSHRIFAADLRGFDVVGREVGWYRRSIDIQPDQLGGKKVFLVFQGAMQTTKLWVNGEPAGEYAVSGYDSFHFDITPYLHAGRNLLAVRVDNTPRLDIPPDGAKTDFIQFGGLYRDVDLVFTDSVHITFPWEAKQAGIRLTLPEVSASMAVVQVETVVRNAGGKDVAARVETRILDRDGQVVKRMSDEVSLSAGQDLAVLQKSDPITDPHLWSPDQPYLYTVESVVTVSGRVADSLRTPLGIRWVRFDKEKGFFLNGEPLELIGANRHQTWPFIGNAVPNRLHRWDAEDMKSLGLNWVRLSHYPHDPDFLDALDELGLMALAEGPSWMDTPSKEWEDNLVKSFRSMIRRDRNRPSIIIWNACVNHKGRNSRLAEAAIEEDPTRERGMDTVRTPMDFGGSVSGGGALTIEHTGHTFATVRGDIRREYKCAQRHFSKIGKAYQTPGNSGIAVWCMYDYNTFHNSRGSIASHGISDLFRLPKLSYYWHKSELLDEPYLHGYAVTSRELHVFSNAEAVRVSEQIDGQWAEVEVKKPDPDSPLHHPPLAFTVSRESRAYRAEGLVNGQVVATHTFYNFKKDKKLLIEADSVQIIADGADITRVKVQLVDENGVVNLRAEDKVVFSIEGAGQLVGESPTRLRAGQYIVLVRSGFKPGDIRVSASLPDRPEIESVGLSLESIPVDSAAVDMPDDLTLAFPTQASLLPIVDEEGADVAPDLGTREWFYIPPIDGVAPGAMGESEPIMVSGTKSPLRLTVRGCEYRVYESEWSSEPRDVQPGDAIFFRMKAATEPGTATTAEVVLDGVRQRLFCWNVLVPKVTADSQQFLMPARFALDSDPSTRWSADTFKCPITLTVDFQEKKTLKEIEIQWNIHERFVYHIEASLDGNNWTRIAEQDRARSQRKEDVFPVDVETRYLRMTVTNALRKALPSIREIRFTF